MRILICDDDLSITQSLSQIIKVYFKKKKVNVLDIVTFKVKSKFVCKFIFQLY